MTTNRDTIHCRINAKLARILRVRHSLWELRVVARFWALCLDTLQSVVVHICQLLGRGVSCKSWGNAAVRLPICKFPAVRWGNDMVRFASDKCLLVEGRDPGRRRARWPEPVVLCGHHALSVLSCLEIFPCFPFRSRAPFFFLFIFFSVVFDSPSFLCLAGTQTLGIHQWVIYGSCFWGVMIDNVVSGTRIQGLSPGFHRLCVHRHVT